MGMPIVFDRMAVRAHRARAARRFADHDFLFREAAERLVERLDDVARSFPRALDLGARSIWASSGASTPAVRGSKR
ncbi:MAG: hypothetical protein ACOVQI_11460 [Tagaea sp.]